MSDDTPNVIPASDAPRPEKRSWRRHTGTKLGHRIEVVEAMLLAGKNISETARAVKASRHTVRAVERQMKARGVAAPERVAQIKEGLTARFALIADQSLTALDEDKLGKAGALELMKIADIASQRAGLVDGHQGLVFNFLTQYNVRPSHSASRPTMDVATLPESSNTSTSPA